MQIPFFITLEGGEGSGKTTNIERLFNHLTDKGLECIKTREPGGTELGNQLRNILLHSESPISPEAELLMMQAARAQNFSEVIKPALADDKIVICDRGELSSIAYQAFGRGLSIDSVLDSTRISTGGLRADLILYLDLDPKVGMERARQRNELDRIEKEEIGFHDRVREGFLSGAKVKEMNVAVIDASQSPESVFADILTAVNQAMTAKRDADKAKVSDTSLAM